MALDQALFEHTFSTGIATVRFYQWGELARTVGYFHRFDPNDHKNGTRPVRRFTGGGVVDHGEDLTFVLNFPESSTTTAERYRWIHQCIVEALAGAGFAATLEKEARSSAGGLCFAQPVTSDIIDATGTKIGGGAQRRSQGSVIHQGSIRLPATLRDPQAGWIDHLIHGLAECSDAINDDERKHLEARTVTLTEEQFENSQWNRWPRRGSL